jgi:hypothetical protein
VCVCVLCMYVVCVCVCVLCMYVVYVVYVVYRGCVFDSSAVQGLSTVQVCVYII